MHRFKKFTDAISTITKNNQDFMKNSNIYNNNKQAIDKLTESTKENIDKLTESTKENINKLTNSANEKIKSTDINSLIKENITKLTNSANEKIKSTDINSLIKKIDVLSIRDKYVKISRKITIMKYTLIFAFATSIGVFIYSKTKSNVIIIQNIEKVNK